MAPKPKVQQEQRLGKRKEPLHSSRNVDHKRQKTFDARKISAQNVDDAYPRGELNVQDFVKAREYEIKALEKGMRNSSKALSSRAFQEVPRELRRRTASHNVKRVPQRLRKRAQREVTNMPVLLRQSADNM